MTDKELTSIGRFNGDYFCFHILLYIAKISQPMVILRGGQRLIIARSLYSTQTITSLVHASVSQKSAYRVEYVLGRVLARRPEPAVQGTNICHNGSYFVCHSSDQSECCKGEQEILTST